MEPEFVDLYAIHKRRASEGVLTLHPSRWLFAGRRFGEIFGWIYGENGVVRIGERVIKHFHGLSDAGLNKKDRKKDGYYFATPDMANRYSAWTPRGGDVERAVIDMLALDEPGVVLEAHTLVGRIDLASPTSIVEVKMARDWKAALGQVLAYSIYHPGKRRVLHLIQKGPDVPLIEVCHVCEQYGVAVRTQRLTDHGDLYRLSAIETLVP